MSRLLFDFTDTLPFGRLSRSVDAGHALRDIIPAASARFSTRLGNISLHGVVDGSTCCTNTQMRASGPACRLSSLHSRLELLVELVRSVSP
jgi:hypothetical protein